MPDQNETEVRRAASSAWLPIGIGLLVVMLLIIAALPSLRTTYHVHVLNAHGVGITFDNDPFRCHLEPIRPPTWNALLFGRPLEAEWMYENRVLVTTSTSAWRNDPVTSDAILARLSALRSLQELRLGRICPTTAGLKHLHRLHDLKTLDLSGSPNADRLASDLAGLPIEELVLDRTDLTDRGVAALQYLPKLHRVYLTGCAITEEALDALRAKKPHLEVLDD